ncbi:hypothetical protein ACQPVP_15870 [Clostridium nigeriense]|uniref:hypothetical protein n=1 Tax=Clostridium nigeriense TaxID=1805470 RepID=UPI003D329D0E
MKVRCIDERGVSNSLTLGKEYEVFEEGNTYYRLKVNDRGRTYHYYAKHRFEEVKEENKMEKSFREVIADIKPGEVWKLNQFEIKCHKTTGTIVIRSTATGKVFGFEKKDRFKLQRKEYTFAEAFKAYEEGKGIESCKGIYYKKDYETEYDESISMDEIRGKWYIND